MAINKPSNRYLQLEKKRELPRALMGGTKAMRDKGTDLTPKHPAEEDSDYKLRIDGTTLYSGYEDTVIKKTGKIFSTPVIVNPDVPTRLADLLDNIDGQGRNITTFLYDAFKKALVDGVSFIYEDFPSIKTDKGFTTDLDLKLQNANPVSILIDATDLIGIDSGMVNGVYQLTEARIKEKITESTGDFETQEIEQIRLLTIGKWEILRAVENDINNINNEWYLYDNGETNLDYIPLVPMYTNRVGFYEGEPALKSLAELNLAHWISSGQQARSLDVARFDMLAFSGVQKDAEIGRIAPLTVFKIEDPAGKCTNVGTSGEGIVQGRLDILDWEKRMETAGMTVRVDGNSKTLATTVKINSEDGDEALAALAESTELVANRMLSIKGQYLGINKTGTVNINVDLGAREITGTIEDLLKMLTLEAISKETFLNEAKRRNSLDEDVDVKNELQRVNDKPLKLESLN